jgi:Brp/Blh family beta-carotene 15,15'-monooxygenase
MSKFIKISLLLSFLGIWISHILSEKAMVSLGYILILTFGIIHGANDIVLLKKNISPITKSSKKLNILNIYILSICFFCSIFYLIPLLGLFIFIIFSCYHFGEQHLKIKTINEKKIIVLGIRITYGLLIILLLLHFHNVEVISIIKQMTGFKLNDTIFVYLLIISIFVLIYFYYKYKSIFKNDFDVYFELLLLVIFSLIFKLTPLIWGFSLYFIIWHSIPSIKSQCEFLYGDFNLKYLIEYLKSGFLIWIISIVGLTIFYFIFQQTIILETLLFSFIAAITFPHVLTIYNLFNKKTE